MGKRADDRIVKRAKRNPKVTIQQEQEALRKAHKRLGIQPKNYYLKYNNTRKAKQNV